MAVPQNDPATVRERLLRAALSASSVAEESGPVEIVVRRGTVELFWRLEPPSDNGHSSLPAIERRLLEVATARPQKPAVFARLAGYQAGSHIRAALTSLARRGLLTKAVGGGYQLPVEKVSGNGR